MILMALISHLPGLPGHSGRRVEHPLRQAGEDLQVWGQSGALQAPHRRRGHTVLRRQGPFLRRPRAGGRSQEDDDGEEIRWLFYTPFMLS